MEEPHDKDTLQKKERIQECCKEIDKLRDVLQRRGHPLDVFAARRQYGHNALRSKQRAAGVLQEKNGIMTVHCVML